MPGDLNRPATTLRPGTDADAHAYIRLIGDAWAEFPGIIFDVAAELPELHALASYFQRLEGALWLAEDARGQAVGMVATRPLREDGAWEIGRMYVARSARGTGLAQTLLRTAEAHARAAGAARMVLWTDTRFEAAHAFYEKAGYVRQGAIRILDDLSKSLEFRYTKPSRGLVVEMLDAAAAASAERRLAEILVACVAAGASVSYLHPLSREKSRGFWKRVSTDVAQGHRVLLAAWADGALAGTVQLDLGTPENQPHRAEVAKLLVDPAFRRRGVGEALMRRAEQAALRLGRSLLTLDTRADDLAEPLYRRLGWQEGGRIPGYALDETGQARDTLFFYRTPG
ncbi:GNAT family N-acetyltransferase [Sediminicoccus sp. KRV36]|uniref:GNAT family N-acetyltransferase n=1 Tax=Sediminicoccus sp. KRV36 TaxID=3133721 RepID=UPI00200FABCB|nr:GNAT family N-acetyltransferase [Sediminicoccus rosea]UPY36144.1 GNAT family N-acetyltransferase [Sediminicoccus rosea]